MIPVQIRHRSVRNVLLCISADLDTRNNGLTGYTNGPTSEGDFADSFTPRYSFSNYSKSIYFAFSTALSLIR